MRNSIIIAGLIAVSAPALAAQPLPDGQLDRITAGTKPTSGVVGTTTVATSANSTTSNDPLGSNQAGTANGTASGTTPATVASSGSGTTVTSGKFSRSSITVTIKGTP